MPNLVFRGVDYGPADKIEPTFEEMEAIEDETGLLFADLKGSVRPARMMAWIVMRRTDPSATWADAGKVRPSELSIVETDKDRREAAKPKRATGPAVAAADPTGAGPPPRSGGSTSGKRRTSSTSRSTGPA